jgi:hypothetical protein
MPAPMTAKCLVLGLLTGFDVDLGKEAAGRGSLDESEAEAADAGWLFDAVAMGLKPEVLGLRLRFICCSPKVIVEPTVCTVMAA